MKVTELAMPGLKLLEPRRFGDERGWFCEIWQEQRYREAGIDAFVQDNLAMSAKGVLRGLHAQEPHAQGKLVQVFQGQVFDVAVDLRAGSPTFAQSHGVVLDEENALLVDVRDIRELQRDGVIPGAFHAPRGMLEFWIDPEFQYFKEVFAEDREFILF